jgi:DNA-directed RNA polymerase subunit RPC12/RpoP
MARTKRTAEKNQKITEAIRKGTAVTSKDIHGRRTITVLNSEKRKVRRSFLGTRIIYNCPKCGQILSFKKKLHSGICMNCGQNLDWDDFDNMACTYLRVADSDEAGYWASQYETICGTLYGIDFEEWRLSMTRKTYPMLLYFPFPFGKEYGRFMRKAAKEATIVTDFSKGE